MEKKRDMFYQLCLNTAGEAIRHFEVSHTIANLTSATIVSGFAALRKNGLLMLRFIGGILIVLFSLTGCVDSPYSGSRSLPNDIDKYISRPDSESLCLQSGTDSACLKLTPKRGSTDKIKVPVIHIHPQKLVYIFYHEGRQILRAERAVDTREIVEALTSETKPDPLPQNVGVQGDGVEGGNPSSNNNNLPSTNNNPSGQNDGNNDNGDTNGRNPLGGNSGNPPSNNNPPTTNNNPPSNNNPPTTNNNPPTTNNNPPPDTQNSVSSDRAIDAHHVYNDGWIIWVDYPDGTEPTGPIVLEKSGLNIMINGKPVTSEDIRNFAQVEDFDGTKSIQFFYPTEETTSSELVIEVDGLVKDEETVTFTMNSPVDTSPEYVTHQTNPL